MLRAILYETVGKSQVINFPYTSVLQKNFIIIFVSVTSGNSHANNEAVNVESLMRPWCVIEKRKTHNSDEVGSKWKVLK